MYDEEYYRYREQTLDFRIEADILVGYLAAGPGKRVLEVGCGGGALLAILEQTECELYGMDMLPGAVALAQQVVKHSKVFVGDAAAVPFGDSSLDCVVSHHLVEHLPDLQGALSEWRRALKPGGRLAICTPNRLHPSPHLFDDPTHLHIYSPAELSRELESAGFSVIESITIFPSLWKDRISVKIGVPLYSLFRRFPLFRERGRSILVNAVLEGES